jgi:hypothetical protein
MKKSNIKALIRNLAIELFVYGLLLVAYFFIVLRYLGDFLTNLFTNQLYVYAFLGLGLIVVQAVFLEAITSYLIRLLRLDRLS